MKKIFALFAVAMLAVLSCTKPEQKTDDSTALALDKTELTLMVGDTYTLKVLNAPEGASASFKSGNATVASVGSKTGKITAKKEGNAVITATVAGNELTCNVTVTPKENVVTSVQLSSGDFSLKEGETKQLTATLKPDDATDKADAEKTLTWSSDDETVATVDNTGKVTAKTVELGATKTANITAKVISKEREIKASVKVTVSSSTILVTGVNLGNEITLNEGGERQLSPSIVPANATDAAAALATIKYKSEDETIATVSATGLIKAGTVAEGETKSTKIIATVTAKGKDGNNTEYKGEVKVNVTSNVVKTTGIQLSKNSVKLNPGETATITATLTPANHTDSPTVTWETNNASVATVVDGVITAKDYGSATITAKISETVQATCSVLVQDGPKAGITIDMSNTYFEYTWADNLASMENVTLEAWVYLNDTEGDGKTAQSFLGTEGVFLIRAQGVNFQAVSGGGSTDGWKQGTETVAGTATVAGEWHHVAATLDSDKSMKLYVDGTLVQEASAKIDSPYPMNGVDGYNDGVNPNIFMVGNAYGRTRFLHGNIAYARVWKVARTQEQIAGDMAKKTPTGDGLIANWYFTEASGNTITDHSSTGANLTPKEGNISWVEGTLPSVN